LRLPLELIIALLASIRVLVQVVNLSHYGLCFGGAYVLYMHNLLLMDMGQPSGWSQGRPNLLNRWMLDTCIKRASKIVIQTHAMRDQLIRYCAARNLAVPIYKIALPRVEVKVEACRRFFNFQLFYPASRWPHKRPELAIAAVNCVALVNAGIGLVITVPDIPSLNPVSAIMMIGHVSRAEVNGLYAGSDALLFVSITESLGLPLLEAMAFGLPIIAPRIPYALELLGDAGCYFDGNSPESVAMAIEDCRLNVDAWRLKIKARYEFLKLDSATWAEHWQFFLNKN
jgi:glycosyltransferase involved in cell wall biosynthesis